jgi:hypothetical protein
MQTLSLRIRHVDGRTEELSTEASSVLVGTGSHCEVRLTSGEAAHEHLLLELTPAGWRAKARAFRPQPTIDGVEFTEAPVNAPCAIAIGGSVIDVKPSEATGATGQPSGGRRPRNPRPYVYLAMGILGCVVMFATRPRTRAATPEPAKVPDLWAAQSPPCPQAQPDPALADANARLAIATSKQERSPFRPEDGVAAVTLFEEAAACFRVAGHGVDAAETDTRAKDLRRATLDDLRMHRLRLQRALATEEWMMAEREARVLLEYFPPGSGEYVTWLSNLQRRLQLRYGSQRKAAS